MRGLYTWYNNDVAATPRTPYLNYYRFYWSQIEPTPNQFDFSSIENQIAKATAVNAKFAFRIIPINPAVGSPSVAVPSDFPSILSKGYYITVSDGTTTQRIYVPDYNDPIYLARAQALIKALGAKYNGDPRIAFVEAGLIGTWGEGNYSHMPIPTPSGASSPGFTMATGIIDAFSASFAKTPVLVPTGPSGIVPTAPSSWHNVLEYSLVNHPAVGMFRNNLGDTRNPTEFAAVFQDPFIIRAGGAIRWQTAPFNTEFYGAGKVEDQLTGALGSVSQAHVALLSNGALGTNSLTSVELQNLDKCGKMTGFRFQLDRVTGMTNLTPGNDFNLTSYWENVGVTPAYERWSLLFQLRSTDGTVIWQGDSSLDFRKLLPTQGAISISDSFALPGLTAPGTYQLVAVVKDPTQYYKNPLALASSGANADGSYPIAHISVVPTKAKESGNSTGFDKGGNNGHLDGHGHWDHGEYKGEPGYYFKIRPGRYWYYPGHGRRPVYVSIPVFRIPARSGKK